MGQIKANPKTVILTSQTEATRDDTLDVLLVEDSNTDAYLIQKALHPLFGSAVQLRISTVPRISDAQALLEGCIFDAIILDLNLLDSNGIESLSSLKSAVSAFTPIIVYSAGMSYEDQRKVVLEGAYGGLSKDTAGVNELRSFVKEAMGCKT